MGFEVILETMVAEKYEYVGKQTVFLFIKIQKVCLKVSGCSKIQNLKGIVKNKPCMGIEKWRRFAEKMRLFPFCNI